MENNYFFYKKVHNKTQCKNKDVLVIFILLQEIKNSNLFDKKRHNSTWRKLTWMNRNWTGKLQVSTTITNYYFRLTFPERNCPLTLPKPLRKKYLGAFWENEGKIHDGGCVKELFFTKLRVGISQLHNRLTSLQTVFRDFKQVTPSNDYFSILYKMLGLNEWIEWIKWMDSQVWDNIW